MSVLALLTRSLPPGRNLQGRSRVRDDRYAVRIVLSSGGDRDLRVVGTPQDEAIKTAREETVVRILG
jgi:hypothetical protein